METSRTLVKLPRQRRIGILTSGSDAPGMNGAVRAAVRMAIYSGCQAFAIHEGFQGLINGGNMIQRIHWEDVRGWLSRGGTFIGTSRCPAFLERSGRLQAAKNMVLRGINSLIVCGGDDSLRGANIFQEEWPGLLQDLFESGILELTQIEPYRVLNLVGLVGSIDNGLASTDTTIGCYSALTRICDAIDDVFDTASSHRRAFVIEVMGRSCGWLALMAAIGVGADWLFIPESPPSDGWESEMCSIIAKNRNERGKRRTFVIISEGAKDKNMKKISAYTVKDILTMRLGLETRVTVLGYTQRGGTPCAYDRYLSTLQGMEAVKAILDVPPTPLPCIITIHGSKIERTPLLKAVTLTKNAYEYDENDELGKAIKARNLDLKRYHEAYLNTVSPNHHDRGLSPSKRMRVAIIHVGVPAGGMNQATRSAVSCCLSRGHIPLAINNGFPGLCSNDVDQPFGSVHEISWIEADNWVNQGGSDIGTNCTLPSDGYKETAKRFAYHRFDAIFIVGGFEAFTAASQLRKAREQFSAFKIPIIVLPATISNNVPGTEYALGSDTCLNSLVTFCDVLKQSASSSRRRVFIVETQGGTSGYISTNAALASGAVCAYIPEEGLNMDMLARDLQFLRYSFSHDKGARADGKLILRNETVSQTYSTQVIADIFTEEAHGDFETRAAIPGYFQQGGNPSPMDRIRALGMAIKCIQHIESYAETPREQISADEMSVSVIGIKGSEMLFSPLGGPDGLEAREANWGRRRPKKEYWLELQDIVNILSGRSTEGTGGIEDEEAGWGGYESV